MVGFDGSHWSNPHNYVPIRVSYLNSILTSVFYILSFHQYNGNKLFPRLCMFVSSNNVLFFY